VLPYHLGFSSNFCIGIAIGLVIRGELGGPVKLVGEALEVFRRNSGIGSPVLRAG